MKITKWVEFSKEVDIHVGLDEIVAAIGGTTDSLFEVKEGINNVAMFLKSIPDGMIRSMEPSNRILIAEFLEGQATRFRELMTDEQRAAFTKEAIAEGVAAARKVINNQVHE